MLTRQDRKGKKENEDKKKKNMHIRVCTNKLRMRLEDFHMTSSNQRSWLKIAESNFSPPVCKIRVGLPI